MEWQVKLFYAISLYITSVFSAKPNLLFVTKLLTLQNQPWDCTQEIWAETEQPEMAVGTTAQRQSRRWVRRSGRLQIHGQGDVWQIQVCTPVSGLYSTLND